MEQQVEAASSRQTGFGAVVLFGLVACVLYGTGAGLRGDIGILLQPLATQCGLAYADVSLCIAVMQLIFGATQPFFGILASRTSNRLVLVLGVALFAASLVGMVFACSAAIPSFGCWMLRCAPLPPL